MHPLNLALGEAKAKTIESLSGMIYENSPTIAIDQKTATITTAHGRVLAKAMLVLRKCSCQPFYLCGDGIGNCHNRRRRALLGG